MKDEIRKINRQCVGMAVAFVLFAAAFIPSAVTALEDGGAVVETVDAYRNFQPPVTEPPAASIVVTFDKVPAGYDPARPPSVTVNALDSNEGPLSAQLKHVRDTLFTTTTSFEKASKFRVSVFVDGKRLATQVVQVKRLD